MTIALIDWNGISGGSKYRPYSHGRNSLRLITLEAILNEAGIRDVAILPRDISAEELRKPKEFMKSIDQAIEQLQPDIIGISVDATFYALSMQMAEAWKRKFGDKVKIIMGGPMFNERELLSEPNRQSINATDCILHPVSYTLALVDT
jgi:hypothetical protein